MPLERIVEPELLDTLPHDHPDALHNRRDLRIFNGLARNFVWLAGQLERHGWPGMRVLEIGAGEGCLGALVARRGQLPEGASISGLDVIPRPTAWPLSWGWHQGDLLTFDGYGDYDVVAANYILHQFDDAALEGLGETLRQAGLRLMLACETQRSRLQMRLLPAFAFVTRMNYVSRHDAAVSLRGGFLPGEMGTVLGTRAPEWNTHEKALPFGSVRLRAVKKT
ncbi:MAG: class I SAM-dependent methyltransferase [Opitutales bacterium]